MARKIIYYNPKLKKLARELRNKSTLAEVILWSYLKNKKMNGFRFHRQKPIENFILDFFCSDLMLAIEIDGNTHGFKIQEDKERQKILENLGVKFLHFTDSYVKSDINGVLSTIHYWIKQNESHTPPRCDRGTPL